MRGLRGRVGDERVWGGYGQGGEGREGKIELPKWEVRREEIKGWHEGLGFVT